MGMSVKYVDWRHSTVTRDAQFRIFISSRAKVPLTEPGQHAMALIFWRAIKPTFSAGWRFGATVEAAINSLI